SGRKPAPASVVLPATNSSIALQAAPPNTNGAPGAQVLQNQQPDATATSALPTVLDQRFATPAPTSAATSAMPPPVTKAPTTSIGSKSAAKPSQEPLPAGSPAAPQTTEVKSAPASSLSNSDAGKFDGRPPAQASDSPQVTEIATAPVAPATSSGKVTGLV